MTSDETKAYKARWRAEHREHLIADRKRYRATPRAKKLQAARRERRREIDRVQNKIRAHHYNKANPEKAKAQGKRWRKENPDMILARLLKKKYGLTVGQYLEMLKAHDGLCAICREPPGKRRLHIDHCHKTESVRGLLCGKCNNGIGLFKDNPALLIAAASYLESTMPKAIRSDLTTI